MWKWIKWENYNSGFFGFWLCHKALSARTLTMMLSFPPEGEQLIVLLLVLCMFEVCLQEEMTACVSLTLGTGRWRRAIDSQCCIGMGVLTFTDSRALMRIMVSTCSCYDLAWGKKPVFWFLSLIARQFCNKITNGMKLLLHTYGSLEWTQGCCVFWKQFRNVRFWISSPCFHFPFLNLPLLVLVSKTKYSTNILI